MPPKITFLLFYSVKMILMFAERRSVMATVYVNKGYSDIKPRAIVVHAYEEGRELPSGVFFGYVRGNRVSLYPCDSTTRSNYRGVTSISIYDLKGRYVVCT